MAAYEKSAKETHSMAQTDGKTPPKLLRLFALYENLIRFVMPLCTALTDRDHPRTPITQSNNIVDISGVGLKQFWNLRGHMQDASTLATAHYPETLDRIFVSHPKYLLFPFRPAPLLTLPDNWRPRLLPNSLVLDQEMVRPNHHLQDFHSGTPRHEKDPRSLHRPSQHPEKVWRPIGIRIWGHAQTRPSPQNRSRMGKQQ